MPSTRALAVAVSVVSRTLLLACALAAAACSIVGSSSHRAADEAAVEMGLSVGYSATLVAADLNNPTSLDFSKRGRLAVCDSGNGRVVIVEDGEVKDHITGFRTEYWKTDPTTGEGRFKLGPLSVVWLGTRKMAVSDSGHPDGEDVVRFYTRPGVAADGKPTNGIGPTSSDSSDWGEGNFTGMVRSPGGRHVFACGQGADAKSWLLRCDVTARELLTFASADDAGLDVNSPMQCLVKERGHLFVLYSGAGGKADGVIATWHRRTGQLLDVWTLPGLVDPMGMDWIPDGSGDLAVVDNNWSPTRVNPGRLARVSLPEGGGEAGVTVLGTGLLGPVFCRFGPDGRLYVCELGEEFDAGRGRVTAISGF